MEDTEKGIQATIAQETFEHNLVPWAGRPQVYLKLDFDAGKNPFAPTDSAQGRVVADSTQALSGQSLHVARVKEGKYIGASVPLLRHVTGLIQLVAREIVTYRETHGAFTIREQLLHVSGLGEKRFTQVSGRCPH